MLPPVFPFRPNWRTPVLERLAWRTNILESRSGLEERIAQRYTPRRLLEYQLLVQTSAFEQLDVLLWGSGTREYALPVWTDPQRLAAPLAAGASAIACTTTTFDFAPGALAVLWRNAQQHEALEVEAVGSGGLTLAGETAQAWPAGTLLYPARRATLPDEQRMPRASATVAQAGLLFELDNLPPTAPQPDALTYRGVEVHLQRPDWKEGLPVSYRRKIERLDYDRGPRFADDLSGQPVLVRTQRVLMADRGAIAAFRGWLHARRGACVPFWAPQWDQAVTLAAPVAATDTAITVRALGAAGYAAAAGRQDLALRNRRTGAWTLRRVTGVTQSGANEVLGLDGAVGFDAAPGQVFATWLLLSRLEADAVEIAWHSAWRAISLFDVRSVRQ